MMSNCAFCFALATCAAAAAALAAGASQSAPATGLLAVKGDRFLLDGKPIKLMGIRVASGTYTDKQCEHLIAQLDEYKAHGVNAVTVFYMGCRGANYDPFSTDGRSVDDGHQLRMERIIQECARRDMVVIVGILYQAAPIKLKDADAVQNAVSTVAQRLRPYRNIIINVCNEQNSDEWGKFAKVYDVRKPENIVELCRIVHQADPQRLVGGGGYDHARSAVIGKSADVDVLLFDTAGFEDAARLYRDFVAKGVKDKPIVNVETFGGITKKYPRGVFSDELRKHYCAEVDAAAANAGLSVFFHNNPWCQSTDEPMRYDLGGAGTEKDPGIRWYFQYVRQKMGPATSQPAAGPANRVTGEDE
jgi:hypothetical protein